MAWVDYPLSGVGILADVVGRMHYLLARSFIEQAT
jgi:hypothetical protein